MTKIIDSFRGEYDFLSNFFERDKLIHYDNRYWNSSEKLYQALKIGTTNIQEEELQKETIRLGTTKESKAYGKGKKKFPDGSILKLRYDWDTPNSLGIEFKQTAMSVVTALKYTQNPDLKDMLIATREKTLIEGNYWHDNYFGICYCEKCINDNLIKRRNVLGKLLMFSRTEYTLQQPLEIDLKDLQEKFMEGLDRHELEDIFHYSYDVLRRYLYRNTPFNKPS